MKNPVDVFTFDWVGVVRKSHTYLIKSNFEGTTINTTNFCSLKQGSKQRPPLKEAEICRIVRCCSRTQEVVISKPIQRSRNLFFELVLYIGSMGLGKILSSSGI
mgnify:CR=1 FL=1